MHAVPWGSTSSRTNDVYWRSSASAIRPADDEADARRGDQADDQGRSGAATQSRPILPPGDPHRGAPDAGRQHGRERQLPRGVVSRPPPGPLPVAGT